MKSREPKPLADLLESGNLAALSEEARRRRRFTAEVRALLSDEEAEHLVSARHDESGVLVLNMDSAAWAARVRFRAAALPGEGLRVRVVPSGSGVDGEATGRSGVPPRSAGDSQN